MPVNFPSLCILLEVKNVSLKIDKDVKISKTFKCGCFCQKKMKRARKVEKCNHLNAAEIRPNFLKVNSGCLSYFKIIFQYEQEGFQEVDFSLV
jgi:hypothetical protein